MNDKDIRDLVIKHDTHIDMLATSIEQLAIGVGSTNTKLESVIEMLAKQNVIEEKVSNMDVEAKEAFNRVYVSLRELNSMKDGDGCKSAQQLEKDKELYDEKLKVVNRRILDLESETKKIISPVLLRTALGLLLIQTITFGTYIVQSIHGLETNNSTIQVTHTALRERVRKVEHYNERNFGRLNELSRKDK